MILISAYIVLLCGKCYLPEQNAVTGQGELYGTTSPRSTVSSLQLLMKAIQYWKTWAYFILLAREKERFSVRWYATTCLFSSSTSWVVSFSLKERKCMYFSFFFSFPLIDKLPIVHGSVKVRKERVCQSKSGSWKWNEPNDTSVERVDSGMS